jgi:Uma2 family endonuclease
MSSGVPKVADWVRTSASHLRVYIHKCTLDPHPLDREELMATAALTYYTPEEYLALERMAEFKSEYIDGRIVAMTGTSAPHNFIAGSIYSEILRQFTGRSCHIYIGDVRVKFGRASNYTYPDVMAVCGAPVYEDNVVDTLTNPALIVEVLSPGTEAYDRGDKFTGYQALDSLREYVLVSQNQVKVEQFVRQGAFWVYSALTDVNATVHFESIGCSLPLSEIYSRVPSLLKDGKAPSV